MKIYCCDCGKLLGRNAYGRKNIRCKVHAKIGKKNSFYGKKHSLKTKEIIGNLAKKRYGGNPLNATFYGKKHTESAKEKNRLAHWRGGSIASWSRIARAIYYENNTNVICDHCGHSDKIQIHHKNKDRGNNHIDNLQALCACCHMKHHNAERKISRCMKETK